MLNILVPVLGYLSGSLPFSIWVTRYVKNVDVRDAGSGHATTTNTIRQAGFGWGALVLTLTITICHGARASVFTGVFLAPLFWFINLKGMELWIVLAGGIVIAYRFLIDWNRQYRELWLDREKPQP